MKKLIMTSGPLRVHPENPRYFTNDSGKAIYLTGSHTWTSLQDRGPDNPPIQFDYDGYLEFMQKNITIFYASGFGSIPASQPGQKKKGILLLVFIKEPGPRLRSMVDQNSISQSLMKGFLKGCVRE